MANRAKFKPQYKRLLFIDERLREDAYPNCSTLAEGWEVSAKTIQRDIDYLRDELRAPIAYDAVRHGFYYTEHNYRLPAFSISESDLFAVMIAEKALRQFRDTPLYDRLVGVFDKIGGALPDRVSIQPEWVDRRITFLPDAATHIQPETWSRIAQGLRENRRLQIAHHSPARGSTATRDVDPYYLVSHKGEWYLIAHSHHHGAIRTFAVSRIESVALLDTTFTMDGELDAAALMGDHFGIMFSGRSYKVRIRFEARLAPYIRERSWHTEQALQEHRDGGVTLCFPTNHLNEVKDWVLSWGAGARALAPAELVRRIRDEVAAMAGVYRGE